jgi:hypothetical protein
MDAVSITGSPLPPHAPTMPMILAANAIPQGSHVGEWRHPDACNNPASNIANAVRLAQIAEAGKMDSFSLTATASAIWTSRTSSLPPRPPTGRGV